MNKKVLTFIDKLEGWKTAIKSLHWSADNMSQHKLCDDIASDIADFQDKVSEVQQGIQDKKISRNELKPTPYKVKNLKTFVKDGIKDTTSFYKTIDGDDYIGMRSDCESFLSTMQSYIYLTDFTLKEDTKRRINAMIHEQQISRQGLRRNIQETANKTIYKMGLMSLNEEQLKQIIKESAIEALKKMNML